MRDRPNRVFNLRSGLHPSFRIEVYDVTAEERATTDPCRDAFSVVIIELYTRATIKLIVQSPVYGEWNELLAARSALSFAGEPSCFDVEADRLWSEEYGEELNNAAYDHTLLGKELRDD